MSLKRKTLGLVAATLMGLATITPTFAKAPALSSIKESKSAELGELSVEDIKVFVTEKLEKIKAQFNAVRENLVQEKAALISQNRTAQNRAEILNIDKKLEKVVDVISGFNSDAQKLTSATIRQYYKALSLGPIGAIYGQVSMSGSWGFKKAGNVVRSIPYAGHFIAPGTTNVGGKLGMSTGGLMLVATKNKVSKSFETKLFTLNSLHIAANVATAVSPTDHEAHSVRISLNIGFIIAYPEMKSLVMDGDKTFNEIMADESRTLTVGDLFGSYIVRQKDNGQSSKFYVPGNLFIGHSLSSFLGLAQFSIGLNVAPFTDTKKNVSYGTLILNPGSEIY